MVRIERHLHRVCMVLIAGSVGFVLYLRFGFTGADSALVGLGVLTALAIYNAIAAPQARSRRSQRTSSPIWPAARAISPARLRNSAAASAPWRSRSIRSSTRPWRRRSRSPPKSRSFRRLVKQLAESVAQHEAIALRREPRQRRAMRRRFRCRRPQRRHPCAANAGRRAAAAGRAQIAAFPASTATASLPRSAAPSRRSKIDLYLQPIVTLPQRKVRYYEAMSRLKAGMARSSPPAISSPMPRPVR
jgi:cyclic-di-GMP phosphodiesterase TipF (flagellum assembly factor)